MEAGPSLSGGRGGDAGQDVAGPCDGCDEDFNNDGSVDVSELLSVIEGWGPCSGD